MRPARRTEGIILAALQTSLLWLSLYAICAVLPLYDQITICGSGKRSYQFGGELTWFQQKDAPDPESRRDRVLLLDHWGQTQGDDLRRELLTALELD